MKIKQMSPQLLVTDLERALDFYQANLGFIIDFRYEDFYAGIINGDHTIHLKTGVPQPRTDAEDLDLFFTVADIEGLYQTLRNRGVNISQALRQMPYGREFYIADPDGYHLGFIEATNQD
ncbi:VOC family protein [Mucilaginibacter angelicae]|uniref:VOC family protein n=1 Tax=Mucilaginibacter angelicae TaxID=869718 RepID=A0ABV6L1L5_9SPHI